MSEKKSLRVITYTDSTNIGGAEISLGHLVATVSEQIEIIVVGVCPQVVEAIAHRRPAATQIVLPASEVKATIAHLTTFHRLQPNIVHVNCCTPWANGIALTAALTLPKARIVRVDQLPLRTTDAVELWQTRFLSLRVDAAVAVGEASARKMEDFYALGRNSVLSVPNCVPDLGEPNPPPLRPNGEMVVGIVGRLDPMKAHDILLQAIAQVDGVRVVIVGAGSQKSALEAQGAELGISDRLQFLGWVEHPRTLLPTFDVLVLPSRSEGFPLSIVEAMLAARPVVATRVGSVAEAVIDGETGILIEKNDVAGLAAALQRLRDDIELRDRLGQRGRAVAKANFTVERMAQRYEELWYKLQSTPHSPRLLVPRPRD